MAENLIKLWTTYHSQTPSDLGQLQTTLNNFIVLGLSSRELNKIHFGSFLVVFWMTTQSNLVELGPAKDDQCYRGPHRRRRTKFDEVRRGLTRSSEVVAGPRPLARAPGLRTTSDNPGQPRQTSSDFSQPRPTASNLVRLQTTSDNSNVRGSPWSSSS